MRSGCPLGSCSKGSSPTASARGHEECPAQEIPASSWPTSGLCPAGLQAPRQAARPPRVGRDCAPCALMVPSPLPDGRAQVRGQHRPGPALSLAGGRALQLWPLPEGSLLHAVAGEMRCRLRQEPRGPSAPPQPGRPSEPHPSGRWRPCPEPLLQSPGPLDGGVRVSPGLELGFSADPSASLPRKPCPPPSSWARRLRCVLALKQEVGAPSVSGPRQDWSWPRSSREGPCMFRLKAPRAWLKLGARWGWLSLHTECGAAVAAPDRLLGECVSHAGVGVPVWQGAVGARARG